MEIAKGVFQNDYKKLNLNAPDSKDWNRAISILENRLKEKYIEPVNLLIEEDNKRNAAARKFGFAIIAIDCLLIETLQSFYDGLKESESSKKQFIKFLRTRESFKSYFPTDKDAEFFYKNYRCGILHQAQTTENTIVRSIGDLVHEVSGNIAINRTRFHQAIEKEIDIYLALIRNKDNVDLRKNFKNKMDYISGIH